VTKTQPAESVAEMVKAGLTIAGENKMQELAAKKLALAETPYCPAFHMIGHLQTNKAKQAVLNSEMIHSVDSVRLAQAINRHAEEAGKIVDVLLEINIAHEGTKQGTLPEGAEALVQDICGLNNINIRGLMCIAPITEHPDDNRVYFERLRQLQEKLNGSGVAQNKLRLLSMGMSLDYEAAIMEGATHIRVGTAIFGSRG